jgi:transposase
MEKERNRNLILYEFKCGHSAAATTRNTCRIEDAVKESTCRRWFAKFLNGEEGLKDKNRSGRKSPSSIVVALRFWDIDGWKSLTITANI